MREIEITTGMNGYPRGLHRGYIDFEDMNEAEQFAKENNGTVVILHQRDGWDLWESKGWTMDMLENKAEDYGDNYLDWTNQQEWDDECRDRLVTLIYDKIELSKLKGIIDDMDEVREKIAMLNENEMVLTVDNRLYKVLPIKAMRIYNDTHHYVIGVEL